MNVRLTCLLGWFILFSCNYCSAGEDSLRTWNGVASYYHAKFNGRKTASGQTFQNQGYTAASNQIPMGSRVRVIHLKNKTSVIVTINDHMAKKNHRLIDLSELAARELGIHHQGICRVRVELLPRKNHSHQTHSRKKPKRTVGK